MQVTYVSVELDLQYWNDQSRRLIEDNFPEAKY